MRTIERLIGLTVGLALSGCGEIVLDVPRLDAGRDEATSTKAPGTSHDAPITAAPWRAYEALGRCTPDAQWLPPFLTRYESDGTRGWVDVCARADSTRIAVSDVVPVPRSPGSPGMSVVLFRDFAMVVPVPTRGELSSLSLAWVLPFWHAEMGAPEAICTRALEGDVPGVAIEWANVTSGVAADPARRVSFELIVRADGSIETLHRADGVTAAVPDPNDLTALSAVGASGWRADSIKPSNPSLRYTWRREIEDRCRQAPVEGFWQRPPRGPLVCAGVFDLVASPMQCHDGRDNDCNGIADDEPCAPP